MIYICIIRSLAATRSPIKVISLGGLVMWPDLSTLSTSMVSTVLFWFYLLLPPVLLGVELIRQVRYHPEEPVNWWKSAPLFFIHLVPLALMRAGLTFAQMVWGLYLIICIGMVLGVFYHALAFDGKMGMRWGKSSGFLAFHAAACMGMFMDIRWQHWVLCYGLYMGRMIFVAIGYHRYFAHRSYKMAPWMEVVMAFLAQTSAQKGALWWAANHRIHHQFSDQRGDPHSPKDGFWWSHVGWILSWLYHDTDYARLGKMGKSKSLVLLNKHYLTPPILLGLVTLLIFGKEGVAMFFLSTVLLWHGTFTVNSLNHVFGFRRYRTTDTSTNLPLLSLGITAGEGYHNNHHHYQSSAAQAFHWWQIDIGYYALVGLSWLRLVWDINPVPSRVRHHD